MSNRQPVNSDTDEVSSCYCHIIVDQIRQREQFPSNIFYSAFVSALAADSSTVLISTLSCNYIRDLSATILFKLVDSYLIAFNFANLKAIRYESMSLNRIVANKSHNVIVALKSVQSTLSHLITTSVPHAMFAHFLVEHGLSQYYLH